MKNIRGVIKKDLDKIFKFPVVFFSTIVLPGLILFLMYALMGSAFASLMEGDGDYYSRVILVNAPESFEVYVEANEENKITYITYNGVDVEEDELIEEIKNNMSDLLIIFDPEFDEKIDLNTKPKITIYSDEMNTESNAALLKLNIIISTYKSQILAGKEIDPVVFIDNYQSVTSEEEFNAFGLAMLIPMLVITFVFAGALGVGTDAIAGEKERGTLSTLLMAPIKRNEIIIGKAISTSIISLLSSLSSFIGIVASLPFAKEIFGVTGTVSYGLGSYAQLLLIILILAMLASSLILLFSTLANTVKSATSYAMPVYIVAILTAVISMFAVIPTSKVPYIIPLYNLAISLKGIMSFNLQFTNFIIVVLSNVVYISIVVFVLVRMFKSEKILFNK